MKVGDVVFVVKRHSHDEELKETTVTKVGRKYFETFEGGKWERFLINPKNVRERDSVHMDGSLGSLTWWESKEVYEGYKDLDGKRQFVKDNIYMLDDKIVNSLYSYLKR